MGTNVFSNNGFLRIKKQNPVVISMEINLLSGHLLRSRKQHLSQSHILAYIKVTFWQRQTIFYTAKGSNSQQTD